MTANDLILGLERYLDDSLGLNIKPRAWFKSKTLPYFLRESYSFYTAEILGSQYLLMVADDTKGLTPATIEKHIHQVRKVWHGNVIYVALDVKSYERRRLIDKRVSFIVPGNQMYLPLLGIDFREYFRTERTGGSLASPSTQVFIIYVLLNKLGSRMFMKEIAGLLPYTSMTVSRIFDEMEFLELGSSTHEGRDRILHLKLGKKELWHKAMKQMRSPVKRLINTEYTAKDCLKIKAGLTALADYSMLAAPERPVFALDSKQWKKCRKKYSVRELPFAESSTYDVEIWHYDPCIFGTTETVDPFSLYLSLREDTDERVQASLNYMMENMKW